jgi:hypothetical protein
MVFYGAMNCWWYFLDLAFFLCYETTFPKRFLSLWYVHPKPCTYVLLRLTLSPNGPKRASTRSTSPRSSIGCAQNDFRAHSTFGANYQPILRGDWHYLQMDQKELPFDPHHLPGPSSAAKKIFAPMVHSVLTLKLSCVEINNVPK